MISGIVALVFFAYLFVSPLILFGRVRNLESRLRKLEQGEKVSVPTEGVRGLTPLPGPSVGAGSSLYAPEAYQDMRTVGVQSESSTESAIIAWLKQDTLLKVGALLLILALAWFVSYAFANQWIGPIGRITLGVLFGAALLGFGVMRMRTFVAQGSVFAVAGSTIIIMTITAAQYVYQMFLPGVALLFMLLVVVFMTFVSLQYERVALAYASLLTALIAPFLINVGQYDSLLLMVYLLLVVAGTLWVVWQLRAEKVTLVALIGVIFYTIAAYDLDTGVALIFSFIFTGIFFITNIISLIRRYTEWVSPVHVLTALLTGVYLIGSILSSSPEEWVSTYLVFWALIFAYGSYQVYLRTLNRTPFYIYAATGVVLLGAATINELRGAMLTIVLTLEVLTAILLLSRLQADRQVVNVATALLIIPGLFTLDHIGSYQWVDGFLHADFFALLTFLLALIVAGVERSRFEQGSALSILGSGQKILYACAGGYAALLLWLVLHSVFSEMVATMFAMIIYSVVGLSLHITGRMTGDTSVKFAGTVVLTLVVLRLLIVDVQELEITGRIITYLVIGLLFMSTALLSKRSGEREEK